MWRIGMGLVITLAICGCNKSAPQNCTPGVSQSCACADGAKGAQACSDDGQRFLACTCLTNAAPPVAANGTPAVVPSPSPAPVAAAPAPAPAAPDVASTKPLREYMAVLTEQDHLTEDGLPIESAADVLLQDRIYADSRRPWLWSTKNDHEGDSRSTGYDDPTRITALRTALKKVTWEPGAEQAVLTRTANVQVAVYEDHAEVKLYDAGQPLVPKQDVRNSILPIQAGGRLYAFKSGTAAVGRGAFSMAEKVRYADFCTSMPGPEAMVTLSYEGAESAGLGGTGSVLLVLGHREGRLELLYSETFDSEHDQAEDAAPGPFGIDVSGFAFDADDPTCCPSKRHVTRYVVTDREGVCKVYRKPNPPKYTAVENPGP